LGRSGKLNEKEKRKKTRAQLGTRCLREEESGKYPSLSCRNRQGNSHPSLFMSKKRGRENPPFLRRKGVGRVESLPFYCHVTSTKEKKRKERKKRGRTFAPAVLQPVDIEKTWGGSDPPHFLRITSKKKEKKKKVGAFWRPLSA